MVFLPFGLGTGRGGESSCLIVLWHSELDGTLSTRIAPFLAFVC